MAKIEGLLHRRTDLPRPPDQGRRRQGQRARQLTVHHRGRRDPGAHGSWHGAGPRRPPRAGRALSEGGLLHGDAPRARLDDARGHRLPVRGVRAVRARDHQGCRQARRMQPGLVLRHDPVGSRAGLPAHPYFETMGPMSDGGRKEFWWEREWRHIGGYHLLFPSRLVAILAPEDGHDGISKDLADLDISERWRTRPLIDPRWGSSG